jgi:GNAT superfamily N-acetyltransferase
VSEIRKGAAGSSVELTIDAALESQVEELARLHALASADLTHKHGRGHWTSPLKPPAVLRGILTSHTFSARMAGRIVGTYRLATKKPWAIDTAYFTPVEKPIYLHSMAVLPPAQRRGIGRALVAHAKQHAANNGIDAIRLDAYDSPAGASRFYSACGFRSKGHVIYRTVPLVYFEWLRR